LTTTLEWIILIKLEVNKPMIAYSRGSQSLAGAASLKNRMPAMVGAFRIHPDIAQLAEQQIDNLWAAGSTPVIPMLFGNSLTRVTQA
jgi:hypothetical protein